jgi:hypothetical protein
MRPPLRPWIRVNALIPPRPFRACSSEYNLNYQRAVCSASSGQFRLGDSDGEKCALGMARRSMRHRRKRAIGVICKEAGERRCLFPLVGCNLAWLRLDGLLLFRVTSPRFSIKPVSWTWTASVFSQSCRSSILQSFHAPSLFGRKSTQRRYPGTIEP